MDLLPSKWDQRYASAGAREQSDHAAAIAKGVGERPTPVSGKDRALLA
jgi:hypothetical protein